MEIPEDASYEYVVTVGEEHAASGLGLHIKVLSTPSLILFMEIASHRAVEKYLDRGYTTVGIGICMRHIKATKIGSKVKVISRLIKKDGRKLEFSVEAYDEYGKIGEGKHNRYVVNAEEFRERIRRQS